MGASFAYVSLWRDRDRYYIGHVIGIRGNRSVNCATTTNALHIFCLGCKVSFSPLNPCHSQLQLRLECWISAAKSFNDLLSNFQLYFVLLLLLLVMMIRGDHSYDNSNYASQCDQIGRFFCTLGNFFKPLATINLPKSLTFLGNFCKGYQNLSFF